MSSIRTDARPDRTIAVVPARAGSQGLPRKNLETIGGRSLVELAVELALGVAGIDGVWVTSDDRDVLAQGRRAGASCRQRPAYLASAEATLVGVVLDVLDLDQEATRFVLLQPTSPLRAAEDVASALALLDHGHESVVSVCPWGHPIEWSVRIGPGDRIVPMFPKQASNRRQEFGEAYRPNGAVYACTAAFLRERAAFIDADTRAVIMPAIRSIDVDSAEDLLLARATRSAGLA